MCAKLQEWVGRWSRQGSLSKVQYTKSRWDNKLEVKSKLNGRGRSPRDVGLVAFSHHAAIGHINFEPKSRD
jgi:hypothetical protein